MKNINTCHILQASAYNSNDFLCHPSFANHHLIMHFVGNLIPLIRGGEELENFYKGGMYTEFLKKGGDLVKPGVPSFSY